MVEIGYALSCEEHRPAELVRYARRAEEAGFTFVMVTDHYHPWIDRQGNSPFAWTVVGAVAQATERLRVGTGVTCPIMRYHPAIIGQAAATAAALMPGRFFLGLGTGEHLNEHIFGEHWPEGATRREMLEEAVEIIRLLWQGDWVSYVGDYFTVEDARLYTLPDPLPAIMIAASGPKSAALAGRVGDGLIATGPSRQLMQSFEEAGGGGKPRIGQVTVCWAPVEAEARRIAREWWPTAGIGGELSQELRLPRHFEQAARLVREDDVARQIVCGPDPQRHVEQIHKYVEGGFDQVYVHQVGPEQEGFFRFYEREVLPRLREGFLPSTLKGGRVDPVGGGVPPGHPDAG